MKMQILLYQIFLYAFIKTENGIYFSVENKKYSPAKEYELTIKEKI